MPYESLTSFRCIDPGGGAAQNDIKVTNSKLIGQVAKTILVFKGNPEVI